MSELIHARGSRLTTIRESKAVVFRMGCVVLISLAIMVSLPGWLRKLEHGPALFHLPHRDAAHTDDAVEIPAAAASAQPQATEVAGYQALAEFLAKRYRVSSEAVSRFIHLAYSAGQITKLDPLLILAVMAVESSFNPIAESVMGAKGLMQVIPHFHQDKLRTAHGAELNVMDPETNILVGAQVLREYASKTGNDLAAALGLYGGTGPAPDNPYASKVLSERQRLEQILRRNPQRSAVDRAIAAKNRT
jgi:soluble lytic murein transglycosylase-like protein